MMHIPPCNSSQYSTIHVDLHRILLVVEVYGILGLMARSSATYHRHFEQSYEQDRRRDHAPQHMGGSGCVALDSRVEHEITGSLQRRRRGLILMQVAVAPVPRSAR